MSFFKKLLSGIFPHSCILCRNKANEARDICRDCFNQLPFYPGGCRHCARIIPYSTENLICGVCLKHPPPFDSTFALFAYHAPVTKIILDLKFQHALGNAQLLGILLSQQLREKGLLDSSLPEMIIPVPLHASRQRERGFNQALEIARPVSKALGIPLRVNYCERTKATLAQATLPSDMRQKNVKNAFRVRKNFQGEHLVVIDDVITTGGTMIEFCRILKKHGAGKIDVWCCARPLPRT